MKKQIAKDLQESGLFGSLAKIQADKRQCKTPFEIGVILDDWLLESDTSEAILAAMGLQVVWFNGFWSIARVAEDDFHLTGLIIRFLKVLRLDGVEKAQRTLANAAALAWLSKQPEWTDKLKAAIESVRANER